jgi:hypothetical protein
MRALDRIAHVWHGHGVIAVVKGAYPHGPSRTEVHLLEARVAPLWRPDEGLGAALNGLVHTVMDDDLFWRAPPPERPRP